MCTAPDYKSLYLELFRASERAVRLLQDAQACAEQHLLDADPPPLRLPTQLDEQQKEEE